MRSNFHCLTASIAALAKRRLVLDSAFVSPTAPSGCTVKATVTRPVATVPRNSRGKTGGGVEIGTSSLSLASSGGAAAVATSVGAAVDAGADAGVAVATAGAAMGAGTSAGAGATTSATALGRVTSGAAGVETASGARGLGRSAMTGSGCGRALAGSGFAGSGFTGSGLRLVSACILIQR